MKLHMYRKINLQPFTGMQYETGEVGIEWDDENIDDDTRTSSIVLDELERELVGHCKRKRKQYTEEKAKLLENKAPF